jgi:hypothetical protein
MGEAALSIVAANEAVQIARMQAIDAQNTFNTQANYCAQEETDTNKQKSMNDAHAQTIKDLSSQKLVFDEWANALEAAKDCLGQSTDSQVFSAGGACFASVLEALAKGISLNFQNQIDNENADFAAEQADFELDDKVKACWHEAAMHKVGIDTAGQEIQARLLEVQSSILKFRDAQASVRENIMAGRAAVAREQARTLPSVEFGYWLNEKVDLFNYEFPWAKHVTFLALKATEYDCQMSLGAARNDILQATTPAALSKALTELGACTIDRKVNGQAIGNESAPLSMINDILKLADETATGGPSSAAQLQSLLTSPASALVDASGTYVGQAIRFTFDKSMAPSDRCAERLWTVTPAAFGDGLTTDGGPSISMRILKKNTFSSRWCGNNGTPGTSQVGVTRPIGFFFAGHEGSSGPEGAVAEDLWATAMVTAWLNPAVSDFDKSSYTAGTSQELAGRGLFGDYMLLIPASEMKRINVAGLSDIFIRFDYEDASNLYVQNKPPVTVGGPTKPPVTVGGPTKPPITVGGPIVVNPDP